MRIGDFFMTGCDTRMQFMGYYMHPDMGKVILGDFPYVTPSRKSNCFRFAESMVRPCDTIRIERSGYSGLYVFQGYKINLVFGTIKVLATKSSSDTYRDCYWFDERDVRPCE